MTEDLMLEAAAAIGPHDVRDYLKSRGWTSIASRRDYVAIFRNGGNVELHVPLDRSLADYTEGMAVLARRLAQHEGRTTAAVIRDLRGPRKDILRFALEGASAAAGSVGLFDGAGLVNGARHVLLASACAAEKPGQKFYPRMSLTEAEAFAHSCKLGQTEIGSFVLTVEAPLETGLQLTNGSAEPFGRRATRYLTEALGCLKSAIDTGATDGILEPRSGAPIVTANLCEGVVAMAPKDESCDLRIRATFSAIVPLPSTPPPTSVYFERTTYPIIEELGRRLRPAAGPQPVRFIGVVSGLRGEPGPDQRMEGTVEVSVLHDDELLPVQFDVGPDDYAKAITAHASQRVIAVRGVLHRGARKAKLEQVTGFEVLAG